MIQDTQPFTLLRGHRISEDTATGAETGANLLENSPTARSPQSNAHDLSGDAQSYNLGTDVFNAPFDARSETWDMPPPSLTAPENGNSRSPLVQSTSSQAPVQWNGQVYNLGTDVFNAPFDARSETWDMPPPSLTAPENGNSRSPLVQTTGSQAPVQWNGQVYNLGADVFNTPFDVSNEAWNVLSPVQSDL